MFYRFKSFAMNSLHREWRTLVALSRAVPVRLNFHQVAISYPLANPLADGAKSRKDAGATQLARLGNDGLSPLSRRANPTISQALKGLRAATPDNRG